MVLVSAVDSGGHSALIGSLQRWLAAYGTYTSCKTVHWSAADNWLDLEMLFESFMLFYWQIQIFFGKGDGAIS